MKIKEGFELISIADEHLAIPIGKEAVSFKGTVALSEAAFFLLKNMKTDKTQEELLKLLISEYDIDPTIAKKDIDLFIKELQYIDVLEK